MDMKKLAAAIEAVLLEHGAHLYAMPEITVERPEHRSFFGSGIGLDSTRAIREERPFTLRITAKAFTVGPWHHESGDDRRLHPDLRSNVEVTGSAPTDL